jgi:hypothetical protein
MKAWEQEVQRMMLMLEDVCPELSAKAQAIIDGVSPPVEHARLGRYRNFDLVLPSAISGGLRQTGHPSVRA